MSFLPALFLLFLGLQLGGVIVWPWVWVFAPLWVHALCVLILLAAREK